MIKDFNGVSGKERIASWNLTKKAMAEGVIPRPKKCLICGKTTGRIDYHNETYASPIKGLVEICMGCHLRWHNKKRFPKAFYKYFIEQGNYKKLSADMKSSLKTDGLI